MKTLKLALTIIVIAAFTCNGWGQKTLHEEIVVTITNLDYSSLSPEIGIVSGTYVYHLAYKLNKAGFLESIHWNAHDFNLTNASGDKLVVTDAGHDNYGLLWVWFNTPDFMNGYIPEIDYDCPEGWLTPYIAEMPAEGSSVEMGCKVICKGHIFKMPFMAQVHINANGVTTVETYRP
jgi:hypothetical protein